MKIKIAIILPLLFGVAVVAQAPQQNFQPSELHSLRLQVKQLQAFMASRDVQDAQLKAQKAYADLLAEAEKVKAEEKWPANAIFNPQSLAFTAPPEAKKPEAKKPEPKMPERSHEQ